MSEHINAYSLSKTDSRITTPLTRLKEIDEKTRSTPKSHLQRWCAGGVCACLGCANLFFKSKKEWQDYTAWVNANKPISIAEIVISRNTEIPFKLKE